MTPSEENPRNGFETDGPIGATPSSRSAATSVSRAVEGGGKVSSATSWRPVGRTPRVPVRERGPMGRQCRPPSGGLCLGARRGWTTEARPLRPHLSRRSPLKPLVAETLLTQGSPRSLEARQIVCPGVQPSRFSGWAVEGGDEHQLPRRDRLGDHPGGSSRRSSPTPGFRMSGWLTQCVVLLTGNLVAAHQHDVQVDAQVLTREVELITPQKHRRIPPGGGVSVRTP